MSADALALRIIVLTAHMVLSVQMGRSLSCLMVISASCVIPVLGNDKNVNMV